jgi:hypothetical protein
MLYDLPRRRFEIGGGGGSPAPAAPVAQAAPTPIQFTPPPPPSLNLTPTYLSQMLPDGQIPQTTAVASAAPGTIDPTLSNVDLSGNTFSKAILAGLAPVFNQQDFALQQSLANAGIVGGSTAGAMSQLGSQQQTQAQGDLQSSLMSLLGLNLNQSQGNQTASNAAKAANVGNILQNDQFNANQTNATNQFDIGNVIRGAEFQAQQGTDATDALAQFQNQDWLSQLQTQAQLASNGANNASGAFQPIFQQPAPVNFGQIGAGLGSIPTITSGGGTSPANPGTSTDGKASSDAFQTA